jgi:hypothetical protein
MDLRRLAVDAAALLALVAAVGLVFLLDRAAAAGRGSAESVAAAGGASRLRLAVTPPEYDDMGKLLGTLGSGYAYTQIDMKDLLDAGRLQQYDVVFLTCGGAPQEWLGQRIGRGPRNSAGVFRVRPRIREQLRTAIRRFVDVGGTLYASDLQFDLLALVFPEFVDPSNTARGAVQTVHAEVIDPGLQKLLGKTVELNFDRPEWWPAAIQQAKATTYIRGRYRTQSDDWRTAPLLVQFPFGEGNVIFTSFHNETQNSNTELELLRYLVFTAVNAQVDAGLQRTMVRGGFSPVERNLLSASGKQSLAGVYECRGAESLEFVLGFEDRGARLRLTVVAPDGTQLEKEGPASFTIDVPAAAAGQWHYTVTPLEVPYPNFPFSLTVGEK